MNRNFSNVAYIRSRELVGKTIAIEEISIRPCPGLCDVGYRYLDLYIYIRMY